MSKELLSKFDSATQEFISVAKSVNIFKLHSAPAEGEWSAAFVIHHLADSDAHFVVRFLNLLSEDNPTIVPFDEDSFPTSLRYQSRSIAVSLNAIEAARAHVVDLLTQIDAEGWRRTGYHPQRGEMTLTDVLELTTKHRLDHIEQLTKLIAGA